MVESKKIDEERVVDELYDVSKSDYDFVLDSIKDVDKKTFLLLGFVPVLLGIFTQLSNSDIFDFSPYPLEQKIVLILVETIFFGGFLFSLWYSFRSIMPIDWNVLDSAGIINKFYDKDIITTRKQIAGARAEYAKQNTKKVKIKVDYLRKSLCGYFIGIVFLIFFIVLKSSI